MKHGAKVYTGFIVLGTFACLLPVNTGPGSWVVSSPLALHHASNTRDHTKLVTRYKPP